MDFWVLITNNLIKTDFLKKIVRKLISDKHKKWFLNVVACRVTTLLLGNLYLPKNKETAKMLLIKWEVCIMKIITTADDRITSNS